MSDLPEDPHIQLDKAKARVDKAFEEVREASLKYTLGEMSDEEFTPFLLEHYKAQMEMAELVAYWPYVPVIYKKGL